MNLNRSRKDSYSVLTFPNSDVPRSLTFEKSSKCSSNSPPMSSNPTPAESLNLNYKPQDTSNIAKKII